MKSVVSTHLANLRLEQDASLCGAAQETKVSEGARFEFGAVYAEHVAFVWRVLRGMGIGDAVVADAVQDVFMVVHRRLPEFDGRHAVKTWLFAIAYRVACNYRRKQKRERTHEPLDERVSDVTPGPSELSERNYSQRLLNTLLNKLDDDKRVVLVLADIEGLTAPEIALVTGVPLNTVYTRLRRARAALNEALEAHQRRSR